jgi:methyl-accepting chemotaxis protein
VSRFLQLITGSIRNKLLVTFLALALVPLGVLGWISYQNAEDALRERAIAQLTVEGTLQKNRLLALFTEYSNVAEIIASNPDILDLTTQLVGEAGKDPKLAESIEVRLRPLVKNVPGLDNAQIMNPKGIIIADTLPGTENQKGRDKSKDAYFTGALAHPGKVFVKHLYMSSTGRPSAAFSITLSEPSGKLVGVVAMRVQTKELDHILSEHTGMGETGDTYLVVDEVVISDKVDPNKRMHMATQSRLTPDSILKVKVDTEGTRRAVNRQTGTAVYADYRGNPVLGYYNWLPELNAALISEIGTSEAFAAVTRLRWIILIVFLVAAVVVVGAAVFLASGLTRQVGEIMDCFGQIGIGNFQARAQVISSDELGATATSLNAMLDNTLTLIQSSEERDKIQASISKLLDEVSGVADGDLTKEAEVGEDMTGAIADSFNYMTEQLRKIIGNVQDATVQVSSSANEIHATAEHLAQGSEAQSEQIINTSAAIDEMAVSIQQVSDNAARSTVVAQQALSNAKQGTESVQNTIQGMTRIREQVQETAKRIKRLGESSQEIGQIIQLIDDIADRTSILALNASIQAAMAGEAGRGFAVVAEEVERLAVRSTDATKKIGSLIKTIQTETGEAVGAMEKSISEVVDGSRVANQAGKALGEIEAVSNQLAELIQSISLASKQQARGSEALAKSMGEISQITQQTAAGTKQAAVSVSELASLADELRASVSQFRLPGKNGAAHGSGNGHSAAPAARRAPVLARS